MRRNFILIDKEIIGIYQGRVEEPKGKKKAIHKILILQTRGCGEHYAYFYGSKTLDESLPGMVGKMVEIKKVNKSFDCRELKPGK